MIPVLYYSRNPNPRLAVAVARHLNVAMHMQWCAPFAPNQIATFRALNPTGRIPILVEGTSPLWEADAIACRLSQIAGSDFWRRDDDLPDMIRWISWGKETFVRACDMVHFERGTKQRYSLGPVDEAKISEGLEMFHDSAAILEGHLARQDWLLANGPSYADFRMASFLPFNDAARLPLSQYPKVDAWAARLMTYPAWADPFAGLDAPALPPVPPPAP